MSQMSRSSQAFSSAGAAVFVRLLVIVALIALAIAGTFVVSRTLEATDRPATVHPIEPSYSRLDDYGLRHPAPVGQPAEDTRLDDYGLRHPVPVGQPTQDSRLDDYGLRHPAPSTDR